MKIINKIKTGTELLILLVLLTGFVSAFGVSYGVGRPIQMYPGESREDHITLQNGAGDSGEDLNVRVEVLQGQDITTLTDNLETYFVQYGKDTQVNFTIKIPEDAKYNNTYVIGLSATTVSDRESGGMGFAMGSGQRIEVIVTPKPGEEVEIPEENPPVWGVLVFVGLAIIIIAIVLILLVKRKLKK
jgi:hypothetical protein